MTMTTTMRRKMSLSSIMEAQEKRALLHENLHHQRPPNLNQTLQLQTMHESLRNMNTTHQNPLPLPRPTKS